MFLIIPNPSSQSCILKVHPSLLKAQITILNSSGQIVLELNGSGQHFLNTSEFQNGVYFVEMIHNSMRETIKLIVIN